LALDDSSWNEQLARVAGLLVNYARGDWLAALEAGARIEISALTTGVQVGFAVGTGAYESDVCWRLCSAVGAFDRFAKRHHFGRARAFAIDGLGLRRLRLRRSRSLRLAIVIHVAALTIFAVTHLVNSGIKR
jgi:hypothetical protein